MRKGNGNMKKISIAVILFIGFGNLIAQEVMIGLSGNPVLETLSKERKTIYAKSSDPAILLPFFDDFSNYTGYPNPGLWQDAQGYVNQSYGVFPPTVGVVTLDALDAFGNLHKGASTSLFPADTLTSRPIRLDSVFTPYKKAITASDSVYLSFFFQPGGGYGNMWERIGSTPSEKDSLLLEFYDTETQKWNLVWGHEGFDLDTLLLQTGHFFKYITILISDPVYFKNGFQFRFRNYASLENNPKPGIKANADQWNIDYIYLNVGRNRSDSTVRDIAFVKGAPSFLKNYQAMPARQFRQANMKNKVDLCITNLYSDELECNYKYVIQNESGAILNAYDGGHDNIVPFFTTGQYQTAPAHATPPIDYTFPVSGGQKKQFTIKHIVRNGLTGDVHPQNDTIVFEQIFKNYYAYDDGIPENGYGLTSTNGVMYLAYQFNLSTSDTLTAIDLFFNRTLGNENANIPFYITIWGNDNGKPGPVLYKSSQYCYPEFQKLNQYYRYILDYGVIVNGTVYVGFEQHSKNYINLGFDRNHDARQFIYYKTGTDWQQSILSGALMMRPYFGKEATLDISEAEKKPTSDPAFSATVYPNPSKGIITVELNTPVKNPNTLQIELYNSYGKRVYQHVYSRTLNISHLTSGLYIVRIVDTETQLYYSSKIILVK